MRNVTIYRALAACQTIIGISQLSRMWPVGVVSLVGAACWTVLAMKEQRA